VRQAPVGSYGRQPAERAFNSPLQLDRSRRMIYVDGLHARRVLVGAYAASVG